MCLIGIAWRRHPQHDLVIAANRDEFHARPSAAAATWDDQPLVFGGRDLSQQGSWLAVSTHGRLAAVTNVRRMVTPDPAAPSRGRLVADFLAGPAYARTYAKSLREQADRYAGFNLLLYDGRALLYVTNVPEYRVETLAPGVHTVSNATLDTPWPKSRRLHTAIEAWCEAGGNTFDPLFDTLADRATAPEAELPDTGIARPLEKMLSAAFIVSPTYGTRCSTVVGFNEGKIGFAERRFGPSGAEQGRTDWQLPVR